MYAIIVRSKMDEFPYMIRLFKTKENAGIAWRELYWWAKRNYADVESYYPDARHNFESMDLIYEDGHCDYASLHEISRVER